MRRIRAVMALAMVLTLVQPAGEVSAQTCPTPTLSPFSADSFVRLPDGKPGVFYSQTITASGGSGSSYFWQLSEGALPPGLSHDGVGVQDNTFVISGTPTAESVGDSGISISVRDAPNGQFNGNCNTANESYRINIPSANLAVSQSALPNPAKVGNELKYTVDVTNFGPDAATNVVLTFSIQPLQDITSATWKSPPVSTTENNCSINSANVTCELGTFSNGQSDNNNQAVATFTLIPSEVVTYTTHAEVTSDVYDSVPGNNQSDLQVGTEPSQADLDVAILPPSEPVAQGAPLKIRVSLQNHGPDTAKNVVMSLTRMSGGSLTIKSLLPEACSKNGSGVRCSFASLPNGASEVIRVNGVADYPALNINMNANVVIDHPEGEDPPTIDPVSSNNDDDAEIQIKKEADLGVKFTEHPNKLRQGELGEFALKVFNHGPSTTSFQLTIVTGRGDISKLVSRPKDLQCSTGSKDASCSATFDGGESGKITFRIKWPDPGDYRVAAQIRLLEGGKDPNPGNNKDGAPIDVV